ncbi:M28 family metallopeptidase [Natronococcus occultus]|uniref:Carboxypeptidase Q n=1 Tax=Natronococcus occultus SP4 TaxID=694430 RepID=L0JYW6_9EURY|nr:M28 family metallopeptidase [Natronococcus occultus]AGB38237.1 putative aminopeptidase [Natronococcus occultus SP4]
MDDDAGATTRDRDPTLERALGRAWADDRPWELLTRLTALPHRMGGSPSERRAAAIVGDALEDAGVSGRRTDEFPMQYWERGATEFAITDVDDGAADAVASERSFEATALPYCPPGDLEGPLVDVGYGTPEEIEDVDLQGTIAVASTTTPPERRFVHRMEKFGHAVAAGAEAFVFANHVPGQLPPTGALKFDAEAAIPGVGVSAETHDWLVEYADRGARARLRVDAATTDGTSRNVHGTLGPETDEEVLVLAHYDAHDIAEGALDNGCGIATVAGAASILADIEDVLDCRVRIAGVGCEEIGLLGAEALALDVDPESVRAVVNVDGAGRFRNLKALSHASATLADLAADVAESVGQPIVHDRDPHPFSDHWPFLRAGVPSLQLHSEPADGGERGRGWGHTAADTRDKVEPRNLREHAMLTALLVRELTRTEVPRVSADELRERFEAQNYVAGMRAAEVWPSEWD